MIWRSPLTTWPVIPHRIRSVRALTNASASGLPSACSVCATFQSLSRTCSRSSTSVTFSKFVMTRRCRARSPSVRITHVRSWSGSRRVISALTSAMNVSFEAVRLAHTRLRVGLGRLGRSEGCWVANRLSITSVGVRWIGGWRWTAATVAIFFLLAFSLFVRRATLIAPSGLTIGMPLQSIAPTRISPSAGPIAACATPGVERVEVHGGVVDELLGGALRDRRAGDLTDERDRFVERAADDRADQPALALVAPQAARQAQLRVVGMDRLMSAGAVSHARDADLAEQGHQRPGVQALVSQTHRLLFADQNDRLTDVPVAARVDVRLQREPEDLAAAALGLTLEL